MIDAAELTTALKRLVLDLEDDLRARVDGRDEDLRDPGALARWRGEYDEAVAASRTGRTWTEWRDDRVTQAAVAWVLTTVFVRFCEDNRLLSERGAGETAQEPGRYAPWIGGSTRELRQRAQDARTAYFRQHPADTDREWLRRPIEHLRGLKATRDLVEAHSALWTVAPSGGAAERILAFWHQTDAAGEPRWDFADPGLSTRFLGDLYQDLSEHAKGTYALLQTPEFVEEFILDRTMDPALRERPLAGFTLIDPTCGSGHFLLGAFARLYARWQAAEPATNAAELARRALAAVHGVDLNPFAVAIARFRLLVTALQVTGERSLNDAPDWPLHVTAGDSLIDWPNMLPSDWMSLAYATEDPEKLADYLVPGRYDVVVGNPPYILAPDAAINQQYRRLYSTCHRKFALTVPFMERFFALAAPSMGDRPSGWVGQITSNSFMKREFGTKLVEDFLPQQDLRLVVDTSGAYIPGHGTPTVILVGRPQAPTGDVVPAVLGIRGEPSRPQDPADGIVWRSIVDFVDALNFENDFISVSALERVQLEHHPWSLTGGGAIELLRLLERSASSRLDMLASSIGFAAVTGDDGVFVAGPPAPKVWGWDDLATRFFVEGEGVRDFGLRTLLALFPAGFSAGSAPESSRTFWPHRSRLRSGLAFGQTREDRGIPWYEYILPNTPRLKANYLIAFAFVATHNHFVLDRGGKVFNRSAPVIKLPEGASEDDHLALLGVLNSSTACFWLKQNSHNKGNGGIGGGIGDESWEPRYEFTGTTLRDYPLPANLPLARARRLDLLAQKLVESFARCFQHDAVPTEATVAQARREHDVLRGEMIAVQEELDWEVYRAYGITEEELTLPAGEELPRLRLGERAFEIALARKIADGADSSAWFERHGSTPITEIPAEWPAPYRELVQRRLDLIASDRFVGLLERPEYKRRWAEEPWDKRVTAALRTWLLDRLERRDLWFDRAGRPRPLSVAQLADRVGTDADLVSVLNLWAGRKDADVTDALEKLLADEVVPYLAAHRLKDTGLRKRAEWERTWELQRAEDRGEQVDPIPVPPKYTSADFRRPSYWSHRGKLDVPKERFVSYPGGGRATDPTTLLGWAGWDHAQQSLALGILIQERESDGATDEVLIPLVAGMAELQPWVDQWHDEMSDIGLNLAEYTSETLRHHLASLGVTETDLRDWRPPAATRGRRGAARSASPKGS